MTNLATLTVADRIALSLDGLARAVAARIAGGAMAAAMIVLVWRRVRRIDRQIRDLLERFQAGRLRVATAPRAGGGGARGSGGGGGGAGQTMASAPLPRRFGWLLAMVPHEAASYASQLRTVLAEPEMVALLQASPQAGRILGPLCRMLGLESSVLRPGAEGVAERGAESGAAEVAPSVRKRVRVARAPVEPWRIPLPRGVLTAARRQGYGKR
jgi:hypothetical protein